jgi:glutathione synthase/RimK-type ligase-like ATP-grasp enzyme
MHRIALVSTQSALQLDDDLAPLTLALEAQGINSSIVCWDDSDVHWSKFDCAILRSTWDYVPRLEQFICWVEEVSKQTQLYNSAEIIRWNTNKHYLQDLSDLGVPVISTLYAKPGDHPENILNTFFKTTLTSNQDFVVKPTVGAGSKDTARYLYNDTECATTHIKQLLNANRSVMLQPYLNDVDSYGETAMIYLNGQFSHAIRKGPLLRPKEGFVDALFAPEHITSRVPSKDEGRIAKMAFNAIPFDTPLYARIDLIRTQDQQPVVLELELTEPSLFLTQDPNASSRMAKAISARLDP